MDILSAIANSPVADLSRGTAWLFTTAEAVHFVGLCVLMGALLIFDLKMLGLLPRGGLKGALRFNQIAGFGVAMNIVSGFILFSSSPHRYWENPSFRLKVLLIVIALANVAWFELVERRKIQGLQDGEALHFGTKATALLSLVLWTTVIIVGRWLPVTGSG